jgi:X-X-X-Leu-X-X-Gly heptad repeat protein
MKFANILLGTLAAGALAVFTSTASAVPSTVLLAKLSVTGKATVNQGGNSNNGKVTKLKSTDSKYNIKDIIKLFNNSPAFVGYLQYQTSTNYSQIPSGAYLAVDLYSEYMWVVLKDGTPLVRLEGYDAGENYRYFGEVGFDNLSADYSYNNDTRAGSETDLLSEFYLSFDDYNTTPTELYAQGTAQLKSKAGKVNDGSQKVNQALKFEGTGDVYFNGHNGTGSQKAKASGKATISTGYWPFWNWWD